MSLNRTTRLLAYAALGIATLAGSAHAQSTAPAKVTGPKIKWDLSTYGNPRS